MRRTWYAVVLTVLVLQGPSSAAAQSGPQRQEKSNGADEGPSAPVAPEGNLGEIGEIPPARPTRPPGVAAGASKSKRPEPGGPPAAGNVGRGYLGVVCNEPETKGRGVRITRITPDSPADKAGLQASDLIVGVGGVRVRQMVDLAAILGEARPDAMLTFEVMRGKDRKRIDVTFGRQPGAAAVGPAGGKNAAKGKAVAGEEGASRPASRMADRLGLEPPDDDRAAGGDASTAGNDGRARARAVREPPPSRDDADRRWEQFLRRIEELERRLDALERREVPAKR